MSATTILLIPAPGDPRGLLADGVCGGRPPLLEFRCCRFGHEEFGAWDGPPASCQHPDHEALRPLLLGTGVRALVLAYEGKPVAEGLDRVARVWPRFTTAADLWPDGVQRAPAWFTHSTDIARLTRFLDGTANTIKRLDHLGTIVLLDAEGNEVSR